MNTVTTIQELKRALFGDGQESGTLQGWVIFDGQKLFVRKHWSYEGGFPAYLDEACTIEAGELLTHGEAFPYVLDGEPQFKHGNLSWPEKDFLLKLKGNNRYFVNKKIESYTMVKIDSETAEIYKGKTKSYCIVDTFEKTIPSESTVFFVKFDSAVKNSGGDGLLMGENFVLQNEGKGKNKILRRASLCYSPINEEFWLRIKSIEVVEMEVSKAYYFECLSEIKDQQKQDREYGYNPGKGYYDIDGWNF